MYSPKLPEELIPRLWLLSQERKVPMTHLVREAVEEYLDKEKGEESCGKDNEEHGTGERDEPNA